MKYDATLSKDHKYRYKLSREWDSSRKKVLFICLNPSTADEKTDDRTVTRCMDFAKRWGFGGIMMGNLFAYRSTDKRQIYACDDPIGPENDMHLKDMAEDAGLIVAAWGNDGGFMNRSSVIRKMFANMKCLQINASGEPKHPLYVVATKELIDYN